MNETYDLTLDVTGVVLGVKAVEAVFSGLEDVLSSISESIREAFSIGGYKDYVQTVGRYGRELTNELLVLQLGFGKLKMAIADAAAPLVGVFVPMLNEAISAVTGFVSTLGQIFSAIFATDNLGKSAEQAAASEEKLAASAKSAGRAVRRSLMDFDELNRLNKGSGGGGGGGTDYTITEPIPDTLSPQVQAIVDKIRALLAPLLAIDLTPLREALAALGASFQSLGAVAAEAMEWLWFQVLTPFIAWVLETLAPAFTLTLKAAIDTVTAALTPLMAGIDSLWQALQPVVDYIGGRVMEVLDRWQQTFIALSQTITAHGTQITGIFQNVGVIFSQLWAGMAPVLQIMDATFAQVFRGMGQIVNQIVGYMIERLYMLTEFLAGAFAGDWGRAWEGIKGLLRSVINGIIDLLNGMISCLVGALNAVIGAANRLSFTVPKWVPGIGGQKFGVKMSTISAPQIPHLAQGAVLPANKPFLAVVGDQRSGTNIEAPLATIQEAVAQVLEPGAAQNLAGQEAILQELQRLRQAVLNIRVGDDTIGRAAERYSLSRSMMLGGW